MRHAILLIVLSVTVAACNNSKKDTATSGVPAKETKANSDEEIVKDALDNFRKFTIDEDYEGMMSLISPTLLKKATKEDLKKELQEGLHNENYDITIDEVYFDDISKVIVKDGNKYLRAKTRTTATFAIKSDEMYESFCTTFKAQYDDVVCNKEKRTVSFEVKGEAYVLYTTGEKRWFILSDSDPNGVSELIPPDIRNELGITIRKEED